MIKVSHRRGRPRARPRGRRGRRPRPPAGRARALDPADSFDRPAAPLPAREGRPPPAEARRRRGQELGLRAAHLRSRARGSGMDRPRDHRRRRRSVAVRSAVHRRVDRRRHRGAVPRRAATRLRRAGEGGAPDRRGPVGERAGCHPRAARGPSGRSRESGSVRRRSSRSITSAPPAASRSTDCCAPPRTSSARRRRRGPRGTPDLPSLRQVRGRTWVTRKGIHVDRIASAWLIRRFIDPEARFKFVRGQGVRAGGRRAALRHVRRRVHARGRPVHVRGAARPLGQRGRGAAPRSPSWSTTST